MKGLRLHEREAVELDHLGVRENRQFCLIDRRGILFNGKRMPELMAVEADYDGVSLALTFPDGRRISDELVDGEPVDARFFSEPMQVTPVSEPLSAALSEYSGKELRLVRANPDLSGIDRGPSGVVSLMSEASVAHLSEVAEAEVDPRRFRMLFEADGFEPHAEDSLVGRDVRIGDARVRFNGHIGRCRVTKMDPETGKPTLETLDAIDSYRGHLETTEPLPFGIYGEVLQPGAVRVGDPVALAA